jgi:hypothetical protein
VTRPSFFIVGAPKCGTTALCDYLRQHPDLFIPSWKEPHYFGQDLTGSSPLRDIGRYLGLFDGADGRLCGEGSVFYLFSKTAAKEIFAFDPNAKIIIMLRNPAEMLHSFHSQLIFDGRHENIEDFAEALAAEDERRNGERIPPTCRRIEALRYTELATFAPQIARYLAVFPRESVHFIVYDDFRRDTLREYQRVLSFLGVDNRFEPAIEVVNRNKIARSKLLRDALTVRRFHLVKEGIRHVFPPSTTRWIGKRLRSLNAREVARPPLDPAFRGRLLQHFAADIEETGSLIDRDLRLWLVDSAP